MNTHYTRRRFLAQTALAAGTLPLLTDTLAQPLTGSADKMPEVHIFSKHLQFLNYTDMADAAATMGFDGVDLSVRPGGHVLPERVETDLPKAVEALKKAGLPPKLMTTAVGNAADATDVRLLKTAARLGFQYYRMTWYPYPDKQSIPDALAQFREQVRALSELNKTLGLVGCYQNHAGLLAGSSVWEIWEMLKAANPKYMGAQYDIRHAIVEGAQSWPNGLRLLLPQIKAITVKDFHWAPQNAGSVAGWKVQDVPLGEGMIDFKTYFGQLKKAGLHVPVTLHIEYPLGGAEHGHTKLSIPENEVFLAMKRDLNRLKALWQAA